VLLTSDGGDGSVVEHRRVSVEGELATKTPPKGVGTSGGSSFMDMLFVGASPAPL
jgi:hypothetical protein